MQALVNMMNRNTTINTGHVDVCYRVHELYSESVIPYLETNRFRPRVLAIQQTRPTAIAYRAKVLGRALLAARTDTNGFWMLLSGNAEVVAFATTTATTTLAENLPTSTTAATTVTVAPVIATASVTVTCHIVAPAAGQKHKAYP